MFSPEYASSLPALFSDLLQLHAGNITWQPGTHERSNSVVPDRLLLHDMHHVVGKKRIMRTPPEKLTVLFHVSDTFKYHKS